MTQSKTLHDGVPVAVEIVRVMNFENSLMIGRGWLSP